MTSGVRAYRELIDAWMSARGGVDGDRLTEDEEIDWTSRADAIWRRLTDEERDEVDRLGKAKVKDGND